MSPLLLSLFTACSDYSLTKATYPDDYDTGLEDLPFESDGEAPEISEDDCVETETAFNIEEISSLQDAFGLPFVRDGLMMEIDLNADILGWRPTTVDVLVMMPDWYFGYYDDSNVLTVHIVKGEDPLSGELYSKSIRIRKSDMNWSQLTLPPGADWSGDNPQQVSSWLSFDMRDLIPVGSFQDEKFFVAVEWDDMGFPNVGYSNFELPCVKNWTDYGDGTWKQNSGNDCSWPMFKIEVERVYEDECD